jgi:23S rRNA (cytidine1920-2'-O)/16S rRNA (cytidine1409-2'-O)-methyltransferase
MEMTPLKPRTKVKKTEAVRADRLLVVCGLAATQHQARALVLAGRVYAGQRRIEKPGIRLPGDTFLRLTETPRYVGRGGDKLEHALRSFALDVHGLTALDVGASTGGFTDCLLQHGTEQVYAVDVGYGQMATRLRQDPRVAVYERTNARMPLSLPEPVDLVVADVSFISLRLVMPSALEHLKLEGLVLVLVKPQFEVGKGRVGKGGVIRDPALHAEVVGGFCRWAIERGLRLLGVRPSALTGDAGNQEFFVLLCKSR